MNKLFQDTNIYSIMQILPLPDDIKYKILILLLGIARTPCANRIRHAYKTKFTMRFRHVCSMHYEINEFQNLVYQAIMCEIRIIQFNVDNKKKTPEAITNIKKYKNILADRFKKKYFELFS